MSEQVYVRYWRAPTVLRYREGFSAGDPSDISDSNEAVDIKTRVSLLHRYREGFSIGNTCHPNGIDHLLVFPSKLFAPYPCPLQDSSHHEIQQNCDYLLQV